MRRLRVPWRWALFAGAFLFALGALLPLRLALAQLGAGGKGLAAEEAVGSVWSGALGGARFGPVALGDVSARLRFLPLLGGQARLDLKQGDGELKAGFILSRHGFAIDDAAGAVSTGPLGGLPAAELELADLDVSFKDGLCESADGVVRARLGGGAPVSAELSGEPRCEGPALLLPLAAGTGRERVDVRLFADGRYRADIVVGAGGITAPIRLQGTF